VKLLLDDEATHERVVRTFHDHLIARAGPETKVVFFYAGHGSCIPDRTGRESNKGELWGVFGGPHDNSLVLHDSRRDGRDGSFDFSDDELHSLVRAVATKTPHVVVITDCCHADGNTRGTRSLGVRDADAGSEPLDGELLRAFWPAKTAPFLDDNAKERQNDVAWVHLAASAESLKAGEIRIGSDLWHGTFSWYLCGALRELRPRESWRTLAETVRARVAGQGDQPGQTVCWSGSVDREVFGGTFAPAPIGFLVERVGANLRIGVGRVHGLGDIEQFEILDLDGKRLGTATDVAMRTSYCMAHWPKDTTQPPLDVALRARPLALAGRGAATLWIGEGIDAASLKDSPWVHIVDNRARAELRLVRDGERWLLQDSTDRRLRWCTTDPRALEHELFAAHCWRALWELAGKPGERAIDLCVRAATDADRNDKTRTMTFAKLRQTSALAAVAEAPTMTSVRQSGGLVLFEVTNRSDQPLWVSLLSIAEEPSVTIVWSSQNDDSGPIEPGGKRTIHVELGPSPLWQESRPMIDRYLAIGTSQPSSFDAMAQEAPVWTPSRGAECGSLPEALQMALSGTRGAPSPWGCAWLDVHLVPPKTSGPPPQKR